MGALAHCWHSINTRFHCRPVPPRLLPLLLALSSPTLQAAAAAGDACAQMAAWAGPQRLLLVLSVTGSPSALLVELEIDEAAGTATEVAAISQDVPPLLSCCAVPGDSGADGGVVLQEASGKVLMYLPGGTLQPLPAAAGLPCACPQMAALPASALQAPGAANGGSLREGVAVLGLSARGQLYCGARQLAADVTSFAVRPAASWCLRLYFLCGS
jgi:hypothetical protein